MKQNIRLAIDRELLKRAGTGSTTGHQESFVHRRLEVDVDHIKSEAEGGTLDHANLRCLCKPCNLGNGDYSEG